MAGEHSQSGDATTRDQASEEEMRAAYEAELNRITSSEMILQTAVSLLNIGGRRLGLGSPPAGSPTGQPNDTPGSTAGGAAAGGERDLEQVRDAIDGVRALMPILERRMSGELGPLRDAIAQLQMAYAREARGGGDTASGAAQPSSAGQAKPAGSAGEPKQDERPNGPGPAESSGRLWVPGR
jgi:hypothetical protein